MGTLFIRAIVASVICIPLLLSCYLAKISYYEIYEGDYSQSFSLQGVLLKQTSDDPGTFQHWSDAPDSSVKSLFTTMGNLVIACVAMSGLSLLLAIGALAVPKIIKEEVFLVHFLLALAIFSCGIASWALLWNLPKAFKKEGLCASMDPTQETPCNDLSGYNGPIVWSWKGGWYMGFFGAFMAVGVFGDNSGGGSSARIVNRAKGYSELSAPTPAN
eukprot:TRINITY_DN3166_c0_g1_i1.p1 TRINITY_DN3166_c0_g1~~TRINITY_DN3166_c0_g1_i1.p1  ORF type:complete len:216 (+),score=44.75 TRINITY_DN3166_c0_g1_i1:98-745(+)